MDDNGTAARERQVRQKLPEGFSLAKSRRGAYSILNAFGEAVESGDEFGLTLDDIERRVGETWPTQGK